MKMMNNFDFIANCPEIRTNGRKGRAVNRPFWPADLH
jgi:hypothetical protein